MSATSQRTPERRRRRVRLSMMETLGFFEDTMTRTTTWTSSATRPIPTQSPAAPRVDPFEGWQPAEVGSRLITGRIRWGQVVGVLMMCAGIAGIAAWLYQRPAELAAEAYSDVLFTAEALEPSLNALVMANDQLLTGGDSVAVTAALLDVDTRARALFEASASLSISRQADRLAASEAATSAIEASRMLSDAFAYRAGVAPILVLPSFQTDSRLVSLDEAARDFGEWQARFDAIRTALPTGVMTHVTKHLNSISSDLPAIQGSYLDALRKDDIAAAERTLSGLKERLIEVDIELDAGVAESHALIGERIEKALRWVSSLIG